MMPDLDTLTPDQREAVEECFHQSDLIGRLPLPCEIEWALQNVTPLTNVLTLR